MAKDSPIATIVPHLAVIGGPAALAFYERAFNARIISRQMTDDGERLIHGVVALQGGYIFVYDEFPEWDRGAIRAPASAGCSTVAIHLNFADADAADACYERAVAAGAVPLVRMGDKDWGERYGRLRDPFGHVWSFAAPVRNGS